MKAATRILVVLFTTTLLAAPTSSSGQPGSSLVVVGILKNRLAAPVVGETVYFSVVTDGRGSLEYAVKDGKTTGILNPQAKTDAQGRFRIEVRPDQLGAGERFALGNWQRWLVRDDGQLRVFQVPAKPTKAGKREIDVGTVIR